MKNSIQKVMYEKRWSIVGWCLILLVINVGLALLFPAIRDTMGHMTSSVPKSMANWIGDAAIWQTYTGYASQELFGEMAIALVIAAILFGGNFLAGYESRGTLLTLLSRPISRQKVYWQKYSAFCAALLIVAVGYFVGILAGGWILGETIQYKTFLECLLMVILLALSLGSVTYAIGAVTGKVGVAGISVGVYAFAAYLLASLSSATDIVNKLSYASLFRYSAAREVVAHGLSIGHIGIFLGIILVSLVIGLMSFTHRDLTTR